MSKYNRFAERLNGTFRAAREKYEIALAEIKEAEDAVREANVYRSNEAGYVTQARKATADAKLADAKAKLAEAKKTIWPEFEREVKRIGQELEQAVKADGLASPDQVDANGLELLKSGVLGADDYASLLQKYDGNPTMLRLLGKYALEAAEGDVSNHDRKTLYMVGNAARNGRSEIMRSWDNLVDVAKRCGGVRCDGRLNFSSRMGKYWDSETVQAFVEGF